MKTCDVLAWNPSIRASYPTFMGVQLLGFSTNLQSRAVFHPSPRLPHVRGDEPQPVLFAVPNDVAFPTCVGMNRLTRTVARSNVSLPHMRGDEPYAKVMSAELAMRFPTCVGMNRPATIGTVARHGLPHMRGDEPLTLAFASWTCCSLPHMRGDEP